MILLPLAGICYTTLNCIVLDHNNKKKLTRPLGRVSQVVAMSVYVWICPLPMRFLGLSLVLRSHDQFKASHWLRPPLPRASDKNIKKDETKQKNFPPGTKSDTGSPAPIWDTLVTESDTAFPGTIRDTAPSAK